MAKCEYCGKQSTSGNIVSHAHNKNKRTWKPNVKKIKVLVNGSPKRVNVCTSCMRSGKVKRA